MIASRIVVVAAVAATLAWTGGALALYQDIFPASADGSMDTYYAPGYLASEGYAIRGDGMARLSKGDQHFGFADFMALSDGPDGIAQDHAGDTADGVLLSDWVVGKKIVSAKLYLQDIDDNFCDGVTAYYNNPTDLIGFRVSNTGRFNDRRPDGSSGGGGGCCAGYSAPHLLEGMNAPPAWRMGAGPYVRDGDIGIAGVIGDPAVPFTPEFYTLSLKDSANPGGSVDATQSFFDADGDGFEGLSGPINGNETSSQDGMYAFEYIMRNSDAVIVNSNQLDPSDCAPFFGGDEPRDAANDGTGLMGWYGVPLDPCLVKLLGSDPEMKGVAFSAIGLTTSNKNFWTRDQNGDEWAPYLHVLATLPGDVSNDGLVDIFDVIDTIWAFGTGPGDPAWNAEADFDCDLSVSIFDVIDAVWNFGQSAP